jgi:hypothetical protein
VLVGPGRPAAGEGGLGIFETLAKTFILNTNALLDAGALAAGSLRAAPDA